MTLAVIVLAGLARLAAEEWRVHVSTPAPTPRNTTPFVSHGVTYYSPPAVLDWRRRLAVAQGSAGATAVALLPILWYLRKDTFGCRVA